MYIMVHVFFFLLNPRNSKMSFICLFLFMYGHCFPSKCRIETKRYLPWILFFFISDVFLFVKICLFYAVMDSKIFVHMSVWCMRRIIRLMTFDLFACSLIVCLFIDVIQSSLSVDLLSNEQFSILWETIILCISLFSFLLSLLSLILFSLHGRYLLV